MKQLLKEIGYLLKHAKGITASALFLEVVNALCSIVYIVALNSLYEKIAEKTVDRGLVAALVVVGTALLLSDVLNGVGNYVLDKQTVQAQRGYMESLFEKIGKLSAVQCQRPKTLDTIQGVKESMEASVDFLIHLEVALSYHLVYYILLFVFLFRLNRYLAFAVLITYVPAMLTYKVRNSIQKKAVDQTAPHTRRMAAYFSYLTDRKFFKETRFWKSEPFFEKKFSDSAKEYKKTRLENFGKKNRIDFLTNFFYVLGIAVVLGVIFLLVRYQSMSAAQVATVITIILSIYESMNELVNFHIAGMSETFSGFQKMKELMALEDAVDGSGCAEQKAELRLSGVGFTYPDAERAAIHDVSLTIRDGETVAIVGENGSGKTTVSKVIAGLYRPDQGTVLLNGTDRAELSDASVLEGISMVFQDFNRYPLSVKENVFISKIEKPVDDEEIKELLSENEIREDPDKLLSREFGGTDVSGGLWQRIAIARASYRPSGLLLFDEPTAAIDPVEEVRIMERLMAACRGKTSVFVTHRIGAAKLADRIVVMKDGTICEMGTHDSLLNAGGEYARLYESQSQWYA